jgi:hypothetical protein
MRSPNNRECFLKIPLTIFLQLFGSRQIYQFKITILVDHKIFRFNVSANYSFLRKILEN